MEKVIKSFEKEAGNYSLCIFLSCTLLILFPPLGCCLLQHFWKNYCMYSNAITALEKLDNIDNDLAKELLSNFPPLYKIPGYLTINNSSHTTDSFNADLLRRQNQYNRSYQTSNYYNSLNAHNNHIRTMNRNAYQRYN